MLKDASQSTHNQQYITQNTHTHTHSPSTVPTASRRNFSDHSRVTQLASPERVVSGGGKSQAATAVHHTGGQTS